MRYVIEIIAFANGRKIINGLKQDTVGVEYGCLTNFASIQEAAEAMRKRWDIKGNIHIQENGIHIGVI
jgi:hypothetical protein